MTVLVLVFGAALLLAVLSSSVAARSPLSTSLVFLLSGLAAGPLGLDLVAVDAITVERAAEVALFAVLFTDGQHAPRRILARHWQVSGRTLLLGLPLTFAVVTALAHWLVGLDWTPALVVGAVLAPTDPVFASALVGRDDVPGRVRHVLNIESGVNDGLALPVVLVLVGLAGGSPETWSTDAWTLLGESGLGVVIGVVVPLGVAGVLRLPGVGSVASLRPLGPLATALLIYGASDRLHANQFLAAFVAGATIATVGPTMSESFRQTGELVSEMAKGGALLAFATLLDGSLVPDVGVAGLVFALGVILVARPLPILAVLTRSPLSQRERLSVAWFGPKGFASVAYAVIAAGSGMESADLVLALVATTVLVSVVAHSSTDTLVARWLADAPSRREGQAA
jgi:sodium/hydrogen antiporter